MKKPIYKFLLLLAVITLTSCGGGGDGSTGGNNNGGTGNALVIAATLQASSLPANTISYPPFEGSPFQTQVDIRVTFGNGQGVATGTTVHLQTNDAAIAFIGIPDDPTTDDNEFAAGYVGVNQDTVGSIATYYIRSNSIPGTVTFTANATHPTNGRNFEQTFSFNVSDGPDPGVTPLLDVIKPRTSLPVNDQNIAYFNGTPFMMETDIQVRDVFENFTNPVDGIINVSINPSNVLYFTKLDDPSTPENDFLTPLAQGFVRMNSGHGTLYLWSRDIPGSATVTLSGIDVGSGFEINHEFVIDVVNGVDPSLPTSIVPSNGGGSLYVAGSGGATTQSANVTVLSGTLPVLDPQVNNIKLSIITDGANSGEKISGIDFSGSSVQGNTINLATVNGIANALVHSGTDTNTITLTATVDRLDNNVDNGIQDGLSAVTHYTVSDGVLWGLELTSPSLEALTVNGPQAFDDDGNPIINNGNPVLEFQDGTYSLVISAIATDKRGNPALPQALQFGLINSPITGYPESGPGIFVHSASDGNPHEGASGFTSASGDFITAAGGVQPNDTLVVFGEHSLGNEDLESAVTVETINSETRLTINENFNRNDESGTINNDLGILPYAVGRAVDGNINATATINEDGVATTRINYPVSQLGRIAAVYVTGHGAVNNGVVKAVTDVELTAFPGVEGFNGNSSTLIVSPNIIPGNVDNIPFVVCIADSARNPLPGRAINFSYVGSNGQGVIDGVVGSGQLAQHTGFDGCAPGLVSTNGVLSGSTSSGLGFNFFAGSLTCESSGDTCMEVVAPAESVLNANPSSFIGRGSATIILTLFDGSGQPIDGASLSGSCVADAGGSLAIVSGPSITNSNGQSTVVINVSLDGVMVELSGICTFATATGSPSVDVNFLGGDACLLPIGVIPSPVPPAGACP